MEHTINVKQHVGNSISHNAVLHRPDVLLIT